MVREQLWEDIKVSELVKIVLLRIVEVIGVRSGKQKSITQRVQHFH